MNEEKHLKEYDQLCRSFEAIAEDKSAYRQRFRLVKLAPFYDIPRAEFRALFKVWLTERGGER